jgi:hypothetical protein
MDLNLDFDFVLRLLSVIQSLRPRLVEKPMIFYTAEIGKTQRLIIEF